MKKFGVILFLSFLFYPLNFNNTNANISPYSDQIIIDDFSTMISNVDITYSITVSRVSLTIFVEYRQVVESTSYFFDNVQLYGDHSEIIVTDEWNRNLLVSSYYNVSTGFTNVSYKLPEILNLGDTYNIALISSYQPSVESNNFILNSSLSWTQNISVYSIKAYIDPNLVLRSSSPPAHSTSVVNQRLELSWELSNIDSFVLMLIYEINLEYLPILVTPNSWDLGIIPKSQSSIVKQYVITNLLNIPVNVSILSDETWVDIQKSITLLPLAEEFIDVEIDISRIGEFEGIITFLTNVSLYAYLECIITFTVNNYIQPLTIASIILSVLSTFLIIGSTLLFLNWRKLKKLDVVSKKLMETYSFDQEKLSSILKETEMKVFNEIVTDPGTTQITIANALDLSKASISRIITKLENKELIVKRNVGMSNQLYVNNKSEIFEFIRKK